MAFGQQRDHELFDHVLLADDDPLHLFDRLTQQSGCSGGVRRRRRVVPGARGVTGSLLGLVTGTLLILTDVVTAGAAHDTG